MSRGLRQAARAAVEILATPWGSTVGVRTRERVAALTFDDGPDPEWTPRFAELLERHGARGTFFLVGRRVRRHPEVVERLVAGGHALGNHGWDHLSMPLLKARYRRRQVRWAAEALTPFEDRRPRLFRPPYGHHSPASHLSVAGSGHRVIAWSAIAEDWRGDPASVLVERVQRRLGPGGVALFHDSLFTADEDRFRDRGPSLEAVEALLTGAAGEWRWVTVPELLQLGSARRWPWYPRPDFEMLQRQRWADD